MREGDKIKISSSGGSGNSVNTECDGFSCSNFNYLEVLALVFQQNDGTALARYGTKKDCGSLCKWEITKFARGNGFTNSNGEIIIKKEGIFSITAQLHNKHGGSSEWIRTNIHIWNGQWWTIMSQRFQLLLKH